MCADNHVAPGCCSCPMKSSTCLGQLPYSLPCSMPRSLLHHTVAWPSPPPRACAAVLPCSHCCACTCPAQNLHAGSDGSRPADRLRVAGAGGFSATAENVAMVGSGSSPSAVVDMWMGSQGHRDNMLNRMFTHVGVAQASAGGRSYWTMVLAGNGR